MHKDLGFFSLENHQLQCLVLQEGKRNLKESILSIIVQYSASPLLIGATGHLRKLQQDDRRGS